MEILMNTDPEIKTAIERFGPDVIMKSMTYTTKSGESFTMLRREDHPDNVPYVGRTVTLEQYQAIWDYHSQFS
jgi:hypothetical protein